MNHRQFQYVAKPAFSSTIATTKLARLLLFALFCLFTDIPYAQADTPPAVTPVVELTHWWVSDGELAALAEIERGIQQRGGAFEPSRLENFDTHRKNIIERINLNLRPAATHWLGGSELLYLSQVDILTPIPEKVADQRPGDFLFDEVIQQISVDNTPAALPVGIHLWNTAYYNAHIFRELGLTPPQTFEELLQHAEKIKAAGYVPLAIGSDAWQLQFLLETSLMRLGGKQGFDQVYNENGDIAAARSLLINAFESVLKLKPYTSARHANQKWHQNTLQVANGSAAMQFIGDFAKGEFLVAGKQPDKDFFCDYLPGTQDFFYYGVDVFALLDIADPELIAGQTLLAETVLDPKIQAEYIRWKGGLPVRKDVPIASLDSCAKRKYADWRKGGRTVISLPAGNSRTRMKMAGDIISKAWNSSEEIDIPQLADQLIATITSSITPD